MMPWTCEHCGNENDAGFERCWHCGTGANGEPPPADWRSDRAPPFDGSERALACLRCASPMAYAGRRHFQDGSYAKEALLGEFFLERVKLDMYRCKSCGKVEFFAA